MQIVMKNAKMIETMKGVFGSNQDQSITTQDQIINNRKTVLIVRSMDASVLPSLG